jgi:hypothetical protein
VTAVDSVSALEGGLADLAHALVTWLETGVRPEGVFAEDVLADLTVPHWRLQGRGLDATFHLREDQHPQLGEVRVEALDRTSRGFLLQFEERWAAEGQQWYCRELVHCVVTDGWISEIYIYCAGDWDEAVQRQHAEQVRLIRP